MQTLKALACASLASLFPLFAELMPREDVVEIPAKAGPEKEKSIAPPQGAPSSNSAGSGPIPLDHELVLDRFREACNHTPSL